MEKTIYNTIAGTYVKNWVTKYFYVSDLINALKK